jgi:hypothetical protein
VLRALIVPAPKQLPDGLLEVTFEGQERPDLFLLEIATYPERRAEGQAPDDVLLVLLDRGVLPEMLTVVLHPKGQLAISGEVEPTSRLGFTRLAFKSQVLELWTVPAKRFLADGDLGAVPLLPLMQFDGPPEVLLGACRERIEREARPEERANLLAITAIMAGLRYNDSGLLDVLMRREVMIESPLLQEILKQNVRETLRKTALEELESRFGPVPPAVAAQVNTVTDEERLRAVLRQAILCASLEDFQNFLASR